MKEIELTRGMVALVDDADFEELSRFSWYADRCDLMWYAARRDSLTGKKVRMHRQLMDAGRGELIDHENRNGLDNQRLNLRRANKGQNGQNRMGNRCGTSPYKGVCWQAHCSKWMARIGVGEKTIYLGIFNHPQEAALVYDDAARRHFGKFAFTNNPDES